MNTDHKAMVTAVAACFLLAAVAGILASDPSDAAQNEGTFEIPMFVGDSFSYTPSAKLSGTTITASGNGLTANGGWLTWSNGTLSGTAAAAGNKTVTLTGTWTSGSLTQVITQEINFKVYTHTVITSASYNSGAVVGEMYTYALTYTGNGQETVSVSTLPSWLSWNAATKVLSGTPTSGFVGSTPSITFTVNNAVTGDSDSITLNLTVYADVAFTSTASTAVINTTSYSYKVTTSATPDIVVSVVGGLPSWLTWNPTTKTLSGTPDLTISGQYVDVQVTLRASSATLDRHVDQNITIRVWANNDFAEIPTIDMVTKAKGRTMTLEIRSTAADIVHVDFGDGTDTFADPDIELVHTFSEDGVYVVRGTVSNEFGSDSMVVMFEALNDEDNGAGPVVDESTNMWDKFSSNPSAIFLAAVGSVALLAFALGARHWVAAAFAIVAILLALGFTVADIASMDDLVEWIKGV